MIKRREQLRRKIIDKLIEWKHLPDRKPLFLLGSSGVGKSYLAYDFGKSFYNHVIYMDSSKLVTLKEEDNKKDLNLSFYFQDTYKFTLTTDERVLLIIDDIDLSRHLEDLKEAISIIKRLVQYDLLLITNYWNPIWEREIDGSFLTLYPLDFEEFLLAINKEWYIESIKIHYESNKKLPDIVHNELLALYDTFLRIGGMPLAVNEYISCESFFNISKQHELLYCSFLSRLEEYGGEQDIYRIKQIFLAMPNQLAKDNQKFKFNLIRKGATYGMYLDGIQFLKNSFSAIPCYKIEDEQLSDFLRLSKLFGWESNKSFKLYQSDAGLLYTRFIKNLGSVNTKALYDNHIAITLLSKGYPLIFWESGSKAKLDFLLIKGSDMIPIEVKNSHHTRSKSFSVFKQFYPDTKEMIKLSTRNFHISNQVKYVPVYAAFCIGQD